MDKENKEITSKKTLEEEIEVIFEAFIKQEIGNRISQFNMEGLFSVIIRCVKKER